MAGINLSLPRITMEELEDDAKLQKILSYLYQLNEQLRYELTHIDDDNISKEGISEISLTNFWVGMQPRIRSSGPKGPIKASVVVTIPNRRG